MTAVNRLSAGDDDKLRFDVTSADGQHATVTLVPTENAVQVNLAPAEASRIDIQVAGMAPAYGLGDEPYSADNANMDGEEVEVSSQNNDGAKQFLSALSVFPRHWFGASFSGRTP